MSRDVLHLLRLLRLPLYFYCRKISEIDMIIPRYRIHLFLFFMFSIEHNVLLILIIYFYYFY